MLSKPVKGALRTQEAPRSSAAQCSSRIVRLNIIYERVYCRVLVVSITARKKELRIDEIVVLAAEFEGVFPVRPTKGIRNLVAVLLLARKVARAYRYAA